MTVLRCVSSKSNTCELMPFISDAVSASIRSRRPSTVAWAGPGERGERGDRVVERLVPRAAERAAHPVDDRALRLAHDRRRDVFETSTDNVTRELTCDVGRGVGYPRRLRCRSRRDRRDASRGESGHERSPIQTGHGESLLVIQTGWECDPGVPLPSHERLRHLGHGILYLMMQCPNTLEPEPDLGQGGRRRPSR